MMNKASIYSVFSVFIPLAAYVIRFSAGPAAAPGLLPYLPLLAFNALGIVLSIIALSFSNQRPTDTSLKTRMALLLANIGLVANAIAVQTVLSIVFPFTHSG
jgi:hypothetical protein